jgi:Protein of unknown function (DUF4199)
MFSRLSPITAVPLRNGSIAGLLGFLLLIALYFMGKHPFLFMIFFDFRIMLFAVFMTLTLKEIRDSHQEGIIFFWQGMIANLVFTALFAVITSTLIWLLCILYDPFLSNYIVTALAQMKDLPAEVITRIGKNAHESNLTALAATNGYTLAKHYFWQSFVISFFISIIISVILRRQPKNN